MKGIVGMDDHNLAPGVMKDSAFHGYNYSCKLTSLLNDATTNK